jgi:hypothetical protein
MATAVIRDDSDEFEIRNALSRSYCALFQACHAWLAMKNVPRGRRKDRPALFEQVRSKRGREYGERLDKFWLERKKADYDEPEFFGGGFFQGDLDKLRLSAREQLSLMEREFDSYASEVETFLKAR